MRILQITAGAAGMYCGSCLRDNALAAELIREGHAVTLVPLYTPTLTDEPNVSQERIFFGGISVYLEQHSALFRHTPWLIDKLWDSRFALQAAARSGLSTSPRMLGELTVSMLRGEEGRQRKELAKLIRWLRPQPLPDLIVLPNSLLIGLAAPLKRALGRPVCCTLQGEDLFLEGLQPEYRSAALALIRQQVSQVDLFLPTSDYYARFMQDYLGIAEDRLHTVPLGIHLDGYERAPARSADAPFTVGYFARLAPEKGLHALAEAYREFRKIYTGPARLEAAGYLAPEHTAYLSAIGRQMADWGLGAEFHYRGTLDRHAKIAFLQQLDIVSAPGAYADPKGIWALEAMACGVPFVQPRHGAFIELEAASGAGVLFAPGDIHAHAAALAACAADRQRLRRLSDNAYTGVRQRYSAARMAAHALEAYRRCLSPETYPSTTTRLAGRSPSSRA